MTELERELFLEYFSQDPFEVSGPVHDDNHFYGRRDEAQDLARQLQQGQVRALLGIRRIGKTSVINRVLFVAEDYHSCFNVMVDCSKDAIWQLSAGQLLKGIAAAVNAAYDDANCYAAVRSIHQEVAVEAAYTDLVNAVKKTKAPVILFFDEVDYITPGSPTAAEHWQREFNPFWRNLRAAFQEIKRTESTLSVLVSGVSTKWFRVESIDGVENAALAFVPEEYLSSLPAKPAIAMIQDIGRVAGLVFDEDASAIVTDACSNIPYWIRKAGSYIHRSIPAELRPCKVGKSQVSDLTESFMESEGAAIAEVALAHLFKVYPELEPVARQCVNRASTGGRGNLLTILERYGVVVTRNRERVISGKMMRLGMRSYMATKAQEEVNVGLEAPERLRYETADEWADEIASLGALRNKLERKLRGIALNFVRMDSLQKKDKAPVKERVAKVLDERRRTGFQHLSADDIVEKYNWTDLVALFEREWSLFEPVFKDKSRFKSVCDVVNIRYDAHAKDADRASVAEYRRALTYLEDLLARL
jgi:hypothetical protein